MAEDGLPTLQQVLPREDSAVGQTGAHPGDPGSFLSSNSQFFQSFNFDSAVVRKSEWKRWPVPEFLNF
jgi:hypothetical protein